MTPSDDDVVARLRASFEATATRTPISAGRFQAIAAAPAEKRSHTLVISMSAAAAVAAIATVATVAANGQQGGSGGASTAGAPGPSSSSASGPAASEPAASGPAWSGSAAAGPIASEPAATGCVPQNYFVIASKAQLTGLTYMLPATPAGYHLYGAWGTIDRSMCADTATWYVEYDDVAGDGNADNSAIQLTAHRSYPGESYPSPVPDTALTTVSVGGQPAGLMDLNGKGVGVLQWTRGDVNFQLVAPLANGSPASILALADSLVAVPADDPRIKAPAGCEVPAGDVCVGSSPLPKTTPSATPTAAGGAASNAPRSAPASLAVG